jgi:hypothetical protein
MRQFMMTLTALAVFGATVVTAQAENQSPSPPTASGPVKKRTVSHEGSFAECEKKALDLGLVRGQAGHASYLRQCMGCRFRPTPHSCIGKASPGAP